MTDVVKKRGENAPDMTQCFLIKLKKYFTFDNTINNYIYFCSLKFLSKP